MLRSTFTKFYSVKNITLTELSDYGYQTISNKLMSQVMSESDW